MELLLQILSVAGQILLTLLIVVGILAALVLFLPLVYKIKVKREGSLEAKGKVKWLFGAILFSFSYAKEGFAWTFCIFGIPIKKSKPRFSNSRDKEQEFAPAKKRPTIRPGERIDDAPDDKRQKNVRESQENTEKKKANERPEQSSAEKWRFTFNDLCDKLKKVGEFKPLLEKALPTLKKFIRCVAPKRIAGYIRFGLEDPGDTGMLLAVLAALCIPIPEDMEIIPDFQEAVFNCDVKIEGKVFIISLLINLIGLFKIPELRKILDRKFSERKAKGKKKNDRQEASHG